MNGIYNLILNNDTFNNIIYNLIDNKSIVIIKKNDNLNYLIEYLNDFILNKFNDITLREIFHDIENNNKCHAVNKQKLIVLKRKITNGLEDIISIFFAFNNKGENGYSLNDLYSITSKSIEFKDEDVLLKGEEDIDTVYVEKVLPQKMKWNLEDISKFSFIRDIKICFKTVIGVIKWQY